MTKDIITGPGEYVNTDGDKVIIVQKMPDGDWLGYWQSPTSGNCHANCYRPDGRLTDGCYRNDITGPWEEPVKAEAWLNVYDQFPDNIIVHKTLESANYHATHQRLDLLHLTYEKGKASVKVVETFGKAE